MNFYHLILACSLSILSLSAIADNSFGVASDAPQQPRRVDNTEAIPLDFDDERDIRELFVGGVLLTRPVCNGAIPNGWIIVDRASPLICGIDGVGSPAGFAKIVPIIARYSDKPAGTIMEVCFGAVPKGWKKISEGYSSWLCGGDPMVSNGSTNVMTIKKKKPRS
jgi:hypothetical protein